MSWIELRLTPVEDGGTRFELEHIAHVDDERWAEFGPGAVGVGWDTGLLAFRGTWRPGSRWTPRRAWRG